MTEPRRLVLDVDVGIDDALMILMLLSDPRVEIVAVGSTHGNCSAEQASINALRVLEAVGAGTVPVSLGLESPLDTPHKASWVHGHDSLADIGLPLPHGSVTGESAPDQLGRLGNERPGELDLIAVGALTNLAAAMQRDPEVLHRYRSVTWLGGVSRRSEPADGFFRCQCVIRSRCGHRAVSVRCANHGRADRSFLSGGADRRALDAIRTGATPQSDLRGRFFPSIAIL